MSRESMKELLEELQAEEFGEIEDLVEKLKSEGLEITEVRNDEQVIFFKEGETEYYLTFAPFYLVVDFGYKEDYK